ncbi:hypothetical protein GCM10009839_24280 [Catenulispora yoronensis]|uniref:Uncharacterized protein n=1 Tax=Catenulispora yoronensis TaxID=450799 RepID=A0ABP5FFK8_9ACTN
MAAAVPVPPVPPEPAELPVLPVEDELDDEHAAVPAITSARAAERTGIFRMGRPLGRGEDVKEPRTGGRGTLVRETL